VLNPFLTDEIKFSLALFSAEWRNDDLLLDKTFTGI